MIMRKKFLLNFILLYIQFVFGCNDGCLKCVRDLLTQAELCSQCMDGYKFQNSTQTCLKTDCEQYQYKQIQNDNSYKCVSICDGDQISDSSLQECKPSRLCQTQYVQPTSISKGATITDVYDSGDGVLYVIYNNFINLIDSSNGEYIRTLNFDPSIQMVKMVNNLLYLLSQNQVYQWNFEQSVATSVITVKGGIINSKSQIFAASNNQNRLFVSYYFEQQRKLIIDQIGYQLSFPIEINYEFSAVISNNLIILQDSSFKIQLLSLIEDSYKKIIIKYITSSYICTDIFGLFLQFSTIQIQNKIIYSLIFDKTNGVRFISDDNSCTTQKIEEKPLQLISKQLISGTSSNISYEFLLTSFSPNILEIYNVINQSWDFIQIFDNPIISFIPINTEANVIKLFILNSAQITDIYIMTYDEITSKISLNKSNTIKVLINNPQKLLLPQNSLMGIKPQYICTVFQNIQLINFSSENSIGVSIDFKEQPQYNEKKVTSTAYDENSDFLLSCSFEGKLIIWDAINPLSPSFHSLIARSNEACNQVLLFQKYFGVGRFNNFILIFNIFNIYQYKEIPINPQNYSKILINQYHIVIIHDQQLSIWQDFSNELTSFPLSGNEVKFSVLTYQHRIYLVDITYQVRIYDFDPKLSTITQNSIVLVPTLYKSVAYIEFFDVQNVGIRLMMTSLENKLFIFDQDLNQLFTEVQLQGLTTQIIMYDSTRFFISMNTPTLSLGFPYSVFVLELINQPNVFHVCDIVIGMFLTNLSIDEEKQYYKVNGLVQTNSISIIGEVIFLRNKGTTLRDQMILAYGESLTSISLNAKRSFYIVGSASGYMGATTYNRDPFFEKFFILPSLIDSDQIQFVKENFNSGLLYVISKTYVFVYNLHTLQEIDKFNFSISSTTPAADQIIKYSVISENKGLFIAISNQQLTVRDDNTQSKYTINTSDQNSLLKMINGCYIDENQSRILVFGDVFVSYSFNLLSPQKISSNSHTQFDFCQFFQSIIACKINKNQMVIYNRDAALSIIQTVTMMTLTDFKITGDEKYGNIFVYKESLDVYSFQGLFKVSLSQATSDIIIVQISNDYLIAFSTITAYIYQRESLIYKTSFATQGGNIMKVFYLKQLNVIAYITNEIRLGQIKFYSLDLLQSTGSLTSQFTENGVGTALKLSYDPENGLFFVDTYGNCNLGLCGSSMVVANQAGVKELQLQETDAPIDYLFDQTMNKVFVYNSKYIWRFNYNIVIKVFQKFYKTDNRFYLTFENTSDILFCDENNNIFFYSQNKIIYQQRISSQINDMRNFFYMKINISLVTLQQSVIVFTGSIQDLSFINNKNNYYEIKDLRIKKFILIEEEVVFIQTFENKFLDYDFLNNKIILSVLVPQTTEMASKLNVRDPINKSWYLFLSLRSGDIIKIDLINKSYTTFPNILNSETITQMTFISSNLIALVSKNSKIIVFDSLEMSMAQDQSINNNLQSITYQSYERSSYIPFFDIDLTNDRYFINVGDESYLGVFQLSTHKFVKLLTFPDVQWKRVDKTSIYLILSCTFQLNFYTQQLDYIANFRKSRMYQMIDVKEIKDNLILVVYITGLEVISVNEVTKSVVSVNFITLTNPKIIQIKQISIQQVQVLGISKFGIFDEVLSILQIMEQSQNVSTQQICYSEIEYKNTLLVQNQFENLYLFSYILKMNYQLSILIDGQIPQIAFLAKDNVSLLLKPQQVQTNILLLMASSLRQIKSDARISNFNLKLSEQGKLYEFYEKTMNIIITKCTIENQQLSKGTTIAFTNKQSVQIIDMKIENVSLISSITDDNQLEEYLLDFQNCIYVLIERLEIKNLNQQNSNFSLFQFSVVKNLVIKQVIISDSSFSSGLLKVIEVNSLRIESFSIINCKIYSNSQGRNLLQSSDKQQAYVLELLGVQLTLIKQFNAQDNNNISLLNSNKQFNREGYIKLLEDDEVYILGSNFENNKFPSQFSPNSQLHLFNIQNTFVQIEAMQLNNNEGNIFISNSDSIVIKGSTFSNNLGVSGASLQLERITIQAQIFTSTFLNNKSYASGGALFTTDVINLQIDDKSSFSQNTAQIGGAIRMLITSIDLIDTIMNKQNILANFNHNVGYIFGNNIGSYPFKFLIYLTQSEKEIPNQVIYEGLFMEQNSQPLVLSQVQSGGNTYLSIKLFDEYNQQIIILGEFYLQNKYPQPIIDELKQYLFELSDNKNNNPIEIKGDSILTVKQYFSTTNSFSYKNLILASIPLQKVTSTYLKATINDWLPENKVQMTIEFRNCETGEIYVQTSASIILCKECELGTYSLSKPLDQTQLLSKANLNLVINQQNCKKCPEGSSDCQKDMITLKRGYWRENDSTDTIVQCNSINPNICDPINKDSKFGCILGHIGPLCETCDFYGKVWVGNSFAESIGEYKCLDCSSQSIQIFYIICLLLAILSYLLASVRMFMKTYMHNSLFSYIRMMKMLPFSKSCIQDESAFVVKGLINYLQITSILLVFNFNFLPDVFSFIPTFAGQPVQKIIVSSSCLYQQIGKFLDLKSEVKLRTVIFMLLPIFFFFLVQVIFLLIKKSKIFQINSHYKSSILNVLFFFFQPDSIRFFISSLTCRSIGDQSYVTTNLQILCRDMDFIKFKLYAITPISLLWILLPLAILFKFIKDKRRYHNLDYCIMKFKFGYFFLEYKQQFFFWEFIRIYLKIFVVIASILLQQIENISSTISIVLITFYVSALKQYKPFQNKRLNAFEEISFIVLIINSFLNQIFLKYQLAVIQGIMLFFHYLLIYIFVAEIVKLKFFKQNPGIAQNLVYKCLKSCLSAKIFNKIYRPDIEKMRILLLWKMVYTNITKIRQQQISQQMYKLQNSQKQSTMSTNYLYLSSQKKDDQINVKANIIQQSPNLSFNPQIQKEERSPTSTFQQESKFIQENMNKNSNYLDGSSQRLKLQSKFQQHELLKRKSLITQQEGDTHLTNIDSVEDDTPFQFQNINEVDFNSQKLLNIIYQQKQCNSNNKNINI